MGVLPESTAVPDRRAASASRGWAKRDAIAAALLGLASAAFVFWQNSQVAVLWDLGYLLDTAQRIALGDIPYRDFPLVHAPLTFLMQAAILRLAGRHYLLPVAYAAMVGGLGTILAWRILLRVLAERVSGAWVVSLALALPLIFLGIYGVYPHPVYDCDCSLAILFSIFLLQRLRGPERSEAGFMSERLRPLMTGAAAVLPLFFKQNMGLPYLFAVVAATVVLIAARSLDGDSQDGPEIRRLWKVLAGAVAAMIVTAVLIQLTAGLGNYIHWTIDFAAQRRLPGLVPMLGVYRQRYFGWNLASFLGGLCLLSVPAARRRMVRVAGLCLMAAPFVWTIGFLAFDGDMEDRADSLLALWPLVLIASAVVAAVEMVRQRKELRVAHVLPFAVLAAIHGTFLSQQLWGSTYAIWPLLLLLFAGILAALPRRGEGVILLLALVVSATFLVCGGLYAMSHDRLAYADLASGPVEHSSLPALQGMSARGSYLAEFEELVHFADREIPFEDALLILPGDEPFYYATGRTPRFPVLIFDSTDDPYSPTELMAEAHRRNVRWVIVKRHMQLTDDPLPQSEEVRALVAKEYVLFRQLAAYDVYRAGKP